MHDEIDDDGTHAHTKITYCSLPAGLPPLFLFFTVRVMRGTSRGVNPSLPFFPPTQQSPILPPMSLAMPPPLCLQPRCRPRPCLPRPRCPVFFSVARYYSSYHHRYTFIIFIISSIVIVFIIIIISSRSSIHYCYGLCHDMTHGGFFRYYSHHAQPLLRPPHNACSTHTRTHARTNERTHARTHANSHAHTLACTYARTHARTHACMHARTHARTHACRPALPPLCPRGPPPPLFFYFTVCMMHGLGF